MKQRLTMFIVSLFLFVGTALAQTKVTGTVLSQEDGEPVIGATIKIVGAGTGAITNYDGEFTVTMPEGKDMIEITYLGCKTEIVKAVNGMRVMLKPDTETLEEVVVVAYGTAKKQSITGSVSTVDQKVIEKRITSNVTSALEGAAPGVQVNNTYGEPGAEPTIRIRGIGSLNGSNTPLYVVDGIIYNGNIADLNPDDIKSMSVLKDAASAALYGNRASAGVVIITTKSGVSNEGNSSINLKVNQGFYNRGIKEYDRLGVNDYMETSWKAMKNWAMTGSMALSEADAKAYASAHLATDVMHQNIADGATLRRRSASARCCSTPRRRWIARSSATRTAKSSDATRACAVGSSTTARSCCLTTPRSRATAGSRGRRANRRISSTRFRRRCYSLRSRRSRRRCRPCDERRLRRRGRGCDDCSRRRRARPWRGSSDDYGSNEKRENGRGGAEEGSRKR